MSEFQNNKNNNEEGFDEVKIMSSRSMDEEESNSNNNVISENVNPFGQQDSISVSKYDEKSEEQEEEEETDNSAEIIPMKKISKGWNIVSGWMKKGADEVQRVTNETVEATAPARGQFYDMSVKMANDIQPATKVMTEVAGSTFTVVSEAVVSTSEIISTSLDNVTQELSEFASEMQHGPPAMGAENEQEEKATPVNISV